MNAWVYMLRCADGSYYVGSARGSLEHRIGQHHLGEMAGYTSKRRPVVLVWSQDFQSIRDAVALERRIKGWSRAKKEALIRGEFERLPLLSARGFKPSSQRASSFETRRQPMAGEAPQDEARERAAPASSSRDPNRQTSPHPAEARSAVSQGSMQPRRNGGRKAL